MRFEVVLFYLFSFLLMSCSSEKKEFINEESNKGIIKMSEDKFFYGVSCSAPQLCPSDYLEVNFIGESGGLSALGNSLVYAGLASGLDPVARDETTNTYYLPKMINATWCSFIDRKVYTIRFLTPYDSILSLFKKGICLNGPELAFRGIVNDYSPIKDNYDTFDLCFLPNGKVVLYVKSGYKCVLLDPKVVGVEVDDDEVLRMVYMKYELKNISEYFDMIHSDKFESMQYWISYLKKKGSAALLLDKYFKRFNYTLNFKFDDDQSFVHNVAATFTNAEHYSFSSNFNEEITHPSSPKDIIAIWDNHTSRYSAYFYFNEDEILRAFEDAYGEDSMQKGELTIKVNKESNQFEISLNVGDKSIKLDKTEIRVFQNSIDNLDADGILIHKNYSGNHHNLFIDDKGYFQE